MTKPVAVVRSVVIEDSRYTVRLDEISHLVLFPSFSRYITSWAISATWPVEASRSRCYRPGSGLTSMSSEGWAGGTDDGVGVWVQTPLDTRYVINDGV
jgi:hypothetical protein